MKLHETVLKMCKDKEYNPVHRQERIEAAVEAGIWQISHDIASRIAAEADTITDEADIREIVVEVLQETL